MAQPSHVKRGTQGPSKGIMPQCRNSTSFSSMNQPAPRTKAKARALNGNKKTQAQNALQLAGYNPIEVHIGLANKYNYMITNSTNWRGGDASGKEIETYVKELTKINETLASYYSSKAPIETSVDAPTIEDSVTSDAPIDDNAPLSPQELMKARRNMISRLDDKL